MPRQIRPIRICGDVAHVPLTQGYTAIIDAVDVPLVSGQNWAAFVQPRAVYVFRKDYSGTKARTVYLHRFLMNDPCGLLVDHEDSDGLNNRRGNLRVATKMQNMRNRRIHRNNKSGFKGVFLVKARGNWVAQITINCQQKYLGTFASPEEAHAAYCRASEKYHGEFGRTE
jgi:hypothetical protein